MILFLSEVVSRWAVEDYKHHLENKLMKRYTKCNSGFTVESEKGEFVMYEDALREQEAFRETMRIEIETLRQTNRELVRAVGSLIDDPVKYDKFKHLLT